MHLPVLPPVLGSKPFDTIGLGLNFVDEVITVPEFPTPNSKIEYVSRSRFFGGPTASTMVALSRLGLKTSYIGRVGSDDVGKLQIESLRRDNVDCRWCQTVQGAETLMAYILVENATGGRTVIWRPDERLIIEPKDITNEMIASGRTLHLDGRNLEAEITAATAARKLGIPVSLDAENVKGADRLFPLIDYFICSAEFLSSFSGTTNYPQALARIQEKFGCPFIGVTLGDKGALALCNGTYFESPAFSIEVRDTTGAGDAFHAGFLYGLLTGVDIKGSLRLANALGALNCMAAGARGGLPTLPTLELFLTKN
jgi:sulfofructose kinase